MDAELLMKKALEAREKAYVPYSGFKVGAALLSETGEIYQGCNIENAAYSPSVCAERTAFFRGIFNGERDFQAIAIAGGKDGDNVKQPCPPCGVCRQVMMEFCDPGKFSIILFDEQGALKVHKLEEILPMGFGPGNLR